MNLVPDKAGITPSYWCTWATQNYTAAQNRFATQEAKAMAGHQGSAQAQHNLNEKILFQEPGWANEVHSRVRGDLLLMLDQGWDVSYDTSDATDAWKYGSLEASPDKFPSLSGSSCEKLARLKEVVISAGWKGTGLWVSPQMPGDGRHGYMFPLDTVLTHFRKRANWCRTAGIGYWKVDWGARGSADFRLSLSRAVREAYSSLLLEHARSCGPLNDVNLPWREGEVSDLGRFKDWAGVPAQALQILSFSDVFKTYDATAHLCLATTLDRVSELLMNAKMEFGSPGILNCEDEVYMGAALGCALGIMRSSYYESGSGYGNDP